MTSHMLSACHLHRCAVDQRSADAFTIFELADSACSTHSECSSMAMHTPGSSSWNTTSMTAIRYFWLPVMLLSLLRPFFYRHLIMLLSLLRPLMQRHRDIARHERWTWMFIVMHQTENHARTNASQFIQEFLIRVASIRCVTSRVSVTTCFTVARNGPSAQSPSVKSVMLLSLPNLFEG